MSIKKIIIIPIAFIFITVFDIACCKCDNDYNKAHPYRKVIAGTSRLFAKNVVRINQNAIINSDTIFADNQFNSECIATKNSNFSFFNKAFAFQCDCFCGANGLKKPFTKLEIQASAPFDGFLANSSLNNLVKIYYNNNLITVKNFNDSIGFSQNSNNINSLNLIFFKPATAFNGNFKINLIFGNTDTVTNETVNFTWQ